MRPTLTAVVFVIVSGLASARAQTWRIGDDQPFPTQISKLPEARQRSILKTLEPSLQKRAIEFQDEPDEIEAIMKSLLIRQITTPSGPLLLIQGWGSGSCGAVGNCAVWVLGTKDQLLLESGGNKIRILPALHHGLPSILMFGHISAAQSDLTWYSFDGSRYRHTSCATETYSSSTGKVYNPPLIEHGPCGK